MRECVKINEKSLQFSPLLFLLLSSLTLDPHSFTVVIFLEYKLEAFIFLSILLLSLIFCRYFFSSQSRDLA